MTTTAFSSPEQAAQGGTRGAMRERAGRAALLGLLAALRLALLVRKLTTRLRQSGVTRLSVSDWAIQ